MNTSTLLITIIIILLLLINIYLTLSNRKQPKLQEQLNQLTSQLETRHLETLQSQHQFETTLLKHQMEAQQHSSQELRNHFIQSNQTLNENLNLINNKVQTSLDKGFQESHKTFTDVIQRLTIIDETQKKIDALSHDIVSLQDVLTDKQTRGLFGEVQLNQILTSIFGDKNDNIFQIQYGIKNYRVDAALFLPSPLGILPIDSKFPLENYRRMVDANFGSDEMSAASKLFVQDCKTHILAISNKYIHPELNIHQAMMFIPAEAIFANINAYHPDIIDYACKQNVWIVSPTTLMSTLSTVQVVLKDMQQQQHAAEIKAHLQALAIEFDRYQVRWDKLNNSIKSVSRHADDISITSDKIAKRFEVIQNVEVKPHNPIDIK